jgi:pyridoxine 5-phosphate synthase
VRLAVNIDHIATLRQARRAHDPEPLAAALLAEMAGAQGITVHLRSDRRHIQDRDLELLKGAISTRLNVEMAATSEMMEIAARLEPYQVTLVPERPQELTTEGGLDIAADTTPAEQFTRRMRDAGVRVSIFLDPAVEQVRTARAIGAHAIEINTGRYADADSPEIAAAELSRIREAAQHADAQKLEVLAGHGLNYVNVLPLLAVSQIVELNIGHSIVARAALVGMDRAVRDMVAVLGP